MFHVKHHDLLIQTARWCGLRHSHVVRWLHDSSYGQSVGVARRRMNTHTHSVRVRFASSRVSNATSGNMPSLRVVVRRPQTVIERAQRDEMWVHASFAARQIMRGRCHEGSSAGDSLLHQTVLFHLVIISSAEPASHYVVQSVSAPIRSIVSRETRSLIAERGQHPRATLRAPRSTGDVPYRGDGLGLLFPSLGRFSERGVAGLPASRCASTASDCSGLPSDLSVVGQRVIAA